MMTRRKYWVFLSLILLPSALAVGTFALTRSYKPISSPSVAQGLKQPHDLRIRNGSHAGPPVAPDAVLLARAPHTYEEPQQTSIDMTTLAETYTAPAPTFDSFISKEHSHRPSMPSFVPTVASNYGGFAGLFGGLGGALPSSHQTNRAQPTASDEPHGASDASPSETHDQSSSSSSSDHSESSAPSADSHENSSVPAPRDSETESQPRVSVPEPATWGLFGMALLAMTLVRRSGEQRNVPR